MYIWERKDWPKFKWDNDRLIDPLALARHRQGLLLGSMARLGFDLKIQAQLETLTEDVTRTSEIEGEILDRQTVRSSLARHLNVPDAAAGPVDRQTEGVVEMMLDATTNHAMPLTVKRLLGWQAGLFPTDRAIVHPVRTGAWRDDSKGPMQVVSGAIGRERIHFQAPPSTRIEFEMNTFLDWFNHGTEPEGLLRAGLAHFWFVTIHPFDDGNGRVARAIADLALAQSEGSNQRFYSMSWQIQKERKDYYDVLERAQKATLDVTDWLEWFLGCLVRATEGAEKTCAIVLRKADFWQRHGGQVLSERQKKVMNRYLDGFEGKLTTKKWAAMGRCSIPTAQRDINDLIDRGIMQRSAGGSRSTSYELEETSK